MTLVDIPELVTLSGPGTELSKVEKALTDVGLRPPVFEDFELDPYDSHGLPSYTDPVTAHAAGKPNAGHTPGEPHPATLVISGEEQANPVPHHGEAYEPDTSVAFFTVAGHPDPVELAIKGTNWAVRMHTAPFTHKTRPSVEELLATAEETVEFLRSQVSNGG